MADFKGVFIHFSCMNLACSPPPNSEIANLLAQVAALTERLEVDQGHHTRCVVILYQLTEAWCSAHANIRCMRCVCFVEVQSWPVQKASNGKRENHFDHFAVFRPLLKKTTTKR